MISIAKKTLNENERKRIARTIWFAENMPPDQVKKYFKQLFPDADMSKLDFAVRKQDAKFSA